MSANKLSFTTILVIGLLLCAGQQAFSQQAVPEQESNLRIAMLAAEAHFDSNTMALTPVGMQSLQGLLKQLDDMHEILSIRIVGHTDDVGSIEFNEALSLQRAKAIRESFAKKYTKAHIVVIGAGELQPIATNNTPQGRERNRRVDIHVIARGYMPTSSVNTMTTN